MIEENAVVRAKRDLSPNVREGAKGIIVMVYDENVTDYDVEFLDEAGNHLDLLTVNPVGLELVT